MFYRQTVEINAKAEAVFNALSQEIPSWWGQTDQAILRIGDEFTISFGATFWKFKISQFEPNKGMSWQCVDAHHVHEGLSNIEEEWIGTEVHWKLQEQTNQIQLIMEHEGLSKQLNCYGVCEPAWDHFILDSLKSYLETGKGKPHLA